jgi:uncharacterized protein (TIGR03437 family)
MTLKTTVTTATGGNWLTVVPTDASLPATLTISIVPQTLASLAPGTYIGAVKVESPTSTNSPQTIQVTLNVAAALPGVLGVVNAASYLAGPVAPGELLYITGTNMGPAALSVAKPNPAYPTVLDDVRVLFDNVPAPLVYVMNDKIVAVVPWIMAGRLSTKMQVEYKSVRSAQLDLQIGTVAPGIFSIAASGSGQGAVLNQDYSVNGVAAGFKRAAKGSVLQVFGTGGGATTPAGLDGQITPGILYPLNVGLAAVTASVGGVPAKVTYAGGAPGLISGALQVNVELPVDAPSGAAVPLVILVGGTPTQANITVAIE